jgi:hypothetical protein
MSHSVCAEQPPALPLKRRNMSEALDLPDRYTCAGTLRHSYVKQLSRRMTGHSPTSSISSNPVSTASSMEDILGDNDNSVKTPVGCVRQGSRLSNYDNMIETNSDNSSVNTQQSTEDEIDGFSPPLPEKKGSFAKVRCSAQSPDNGVCLYDGITSQLTAMSLSSSAMMQQCTSNEFWMTRNSVQFQSASASYQTNVTSTSAVQMTKSVHVADGFMSATHLQPEVLNPDMMISSIAPPLPPKLKHSLYCFTLLQFFCVCEVRLLGFGQFVSPDGCQNVQVKLWCLSRPVCFCSHLCMHW